jgi:hypothetical protein
MYKICEKILFKLVLSKIVSVRAPSRRDVARAHALRVAGRVLPVIGRGECFP